MGEYVASQVIKLMIKKGISVKDANVLMLGITFKENCPDVRNTKIVDTVKALEDYGVKVAIFDPWANPSEVKHEYNLVTSQNINTDKKIRSRSFRRCPQRIFRNKFKRIYDTNRCFI